MITTGTALHRFRLGVASSTRFAPKFLPYRFSAYTKPA